MPSRIERAQSAYYHKDLHASKMAHTKEAIKKHMEKHSKEKGQYLGDVVFGASDGIVTTFAVVSGVEGADLSKAVVLILGFAKLFADALSMAIGNYLSTKSELDYIENERKREEWEVDNIPEGEREEIAEIFRKKGFKGGLLRRVVNVITASKKVWVDTMMMQELGLTSSDKTPVMSSIATFIAFIVAGFVPLLAFVLALFIPLQINTFLLSIIMTGMTLFGVGALRSNVTGKNWIRSGIEMLVVGGAAATVAFLIGSALSGLSNVL